jgi:hypothetical protein
MGEWSLHNRWPSDSAPSELDWFHGYDVVGHRFALVASVLRAAAAMQANRLPVQNGRCR